MPPNVNRSKPTSAEVRAKYKRYLFPSVATYYAEAVALESGKGSVVRDFDGATYLDFFGGILTVGVGHANERVNAAAQAFEMDRLGQRLDALPQRRCRSPSLRRAAGPRWHARQAFPRESMFFCSSGTEADETAVLLAQAHTGRQEVIALRHGYSGALDPRAGVDGAARRGTGQTTTQIAVA